MAVGNTYDACAIVGATSLFGCLHNLLRDNATVWCRDSRLFHLTWDTFLNEMPKPQAYFGDIRCGDGRRERDGLRNAYGKKSVAGEVTIIMV